ncbi:hypothetical protein L207DRAFT_62850 [Hyaloscypha variabilis F]|uniref:Uncharacterized protein n=1 Tax=Hyaloscypha variabilis (strain UAMH 11265 / GT02V1 / F) TaxID=1149755 RepID=A0A2J6RI30_HYAVF|nr:hypothetical protein L207DRAFT_62850 [Hyaloscypha variabilis F]
MPGVQRVLSVPGWERSDKSLRTREARASILTRVLRVSCSRHMEKQIHCTARLNGRARPPGSSGFGISRVRRGSKTRPQIKNQPPHENILPTARNHSIPHSQLALRLQIRDSASLRALHNQN